MAKTELIEKTSRIKIGPKVGEEISAEIDRLVYELKTTPQQARQQTILKRIGSLAALLAQAFVVLAIAGEPLT